VRLSAPYTGHDGVRESFADAARVWDNLTLHADDFRVAVGGVVVFGRIEGGRRPHRRAVRNERHLGLARTR
jgi:hypothetical protein